MAKVIGIGNESFQEIRENDCFLMASPIINIK